MTTPKITTPKGNPLGAPRAEIDNKMLDMAFVETADYRALIETQDINIVVGRRGTGKTALFIKTSAHFNRAPGVFLFTVRPEEHETRVIHDVVESIVQNYSEIRMVSQLAWRFSLMLHLTASLIEDYKFGKSEDASFLRDCLIKASEYKASSPAEITSRLLKDRLTDKTSGVSAVMNELATDFRLRKWANAIKNELCEMKKTAVFLFDGLDEGWTADITSTGIIGGLVAAVASFQDLNIGIRGILFVRDNIFRALSTLDIDSSRHIEGNTIRLHWDEDSLLHFASNRLRISLGLNDIESDTKVWNRFAHRELRNRTGFVECLHKTLYRPRDLLVLLNRASQIAARSGRLEIIGDDIQSTALEVSQDRLSDLLKEYRWVFPGLGLLIGAFRDCSAIANYSVIIDHLDSWLQDASYEQPETSDFAILGTGKEAFNALYSIGFIGVENRETQHFVFCHDGTRTFHSDVEPTQRTAIHPCYWSAFNIMDKDVPNQILVEVTDDYKPVLDTKVQDQRTKMIGQIVSELPSISLGKEGYHDFEKWLLRTTKILFAGKLVNAELNPNKNSVERRDIVARNDATSGFWRHILEDYGSRQVIFEAKNYLELRPEDFRQALSYTSDIYGKFIIIVTRTEQEALGNTEKGWLKEIWDNHKVLVFVLPASILARGISKLRRADRQDYIETVLLKRLDIFVRNYLSLRHIKPVKKKKKNKKAQPRS